MGSSKKKPTDRLTVVFTIIFIILAGLSGFFYYRLTLQQTLINNLQEDYTLQQEEYLTLFQLYHQISNYYNETQDMYTTLTEEYMVLGDLYTETLQEKTELENTLSELENEHNTTTTDLSELQYEHYLLGLERDAIQREYDDLINYRKTMFLEVYMIPLIFNMLEIRMKKSQVFGIVLLAILSMSLAIPVLASDPGGDKVLIDIKPLSCPSSINPNSRGKTPVAILTTGSFDASTVDPTSVMFAGASPVKWALNDFDGDGDLDLVLKFKTQECSFELYNHYAYLTGETFGGDLIWGKGWVNIVPN